MTEPNNTIYPTHSCFDDAMEFADYVLIEYRDEDTSFLKLVHGIVTGDDGSFHAHAWLEDSATEVAIFAGILKGEKIYFYMPVSDFYSGYRVQDCTKYTLEEAMENNIQTVHFGPWEPKYKALIGGKGTFIVKGEGRVGTIGKLPSKEVAK